MTAIVELKNATKIVKNGFDEEKIILNDVSLEIFEREGLYHDFGRKWCWKINSL